MTTHESKLENFAACVESSMGAPEYLDLDAAIEAARKMGQDHMDSAQLAEAESRVRQRGLRKMKYRIHYYGPDGTGGPVAAPPAIDGQIFDSLEDARYSIERELGGTTYGKWSGDAEENDVEAWHESEDEGCGGYAISEVEAEFTNPVRCTACGETCEFSEAKHDQGYVYCPACIAADPDLR